MTANTQIKPTGIFENGDLYYGEMEEDESGKWYTAVCDTGLDYQTRERPDVFVLFCMTVFPDGTPESFVKEYQLARKIGDARFGSACHHSRAKRGYCPDCCRRVR